MSLNDTERLKCSTCLRNILSHNQKVNCYNKTHWFHKKCLPNFTENDFIYAKNTTNYWSCTICNTTNFPFNNIEDDEEFIKMANKQNFLTSTLNNEDLIEKLINPADIDKEIHDQYLNDIDPDLNYYAQEINSTLESSNYQSTDLINININNMNSMSNYVFSLLHLNIRSAPKNLHSLQLMLENIKHRFCCIGLSETWFKDSNVNTYNLDGYKHKFYVREKKLGGGISVFIKDDISYRVRKDLGSSNSDFEVIWIELLKDEYFIHSNIIIGTIYRIPNTSINSFNDY